MHRMISIPIDNQLLLDLMTTAIEGGSNYWARFAHCERDSDMNYLKVTVVEDEPSSGTKRKQMVITPHEMAIGLERLAACAVNSKFPDGTDFPAAAKHFGDAIGDHDATTADVVLQMAMFGELIYG